MRKLSMAAVAAVLALGANASSPDEAEARTASVCQFYRGEPLCKTVESSNCFTAEIGVGARTCTTTTEYWYWS